jgi:hypothetical protein
MGGTTMIPISLVSLAFLGSIVASSSVQSTVSSARVAAVRFALAQGWQLPTTNAVVALETTFGWPDGTPVKQSAEETAREAAEIAKLLGPSVRTGRAGDHVLCPERRCYAANDVWVIIVDGLAAGEIDIRIRVFAPDAVRNQPSTLTSAVIDLERRENGWIGTRYRRTPNTIITRR